MKRDLKGSDVENALNILDYLKMNQEDIKNYVIPLLEKIALTKSSNAVATSLSLYRFHRLFANHILIIFWRMLQVTQRIQRHNLYVP